MISSFTQRQRSRPEDMNRMMEIGGRYLLLERIDAGRCAEVHLALDRKEDRPVAAKLGFRGRDLGFTRTVFRNEARALELGASQNVVRLIDADASAKEPFIIMDYVPGPTLRTLTFDRTVDADAAVRIIIGILDGIGKMHSSGVVHRDLKPKNIMLGSEREVRIIDLGFASVQGMPDFTSASDKRFGHPIYSPPERMNGKGDPRADIYSVGMMMYELMGGSACRLLDSVRMLGAHIIPSLVSADAAVGLISRNAAEIIRKSLSRDPRDRYQCARDMKSAVGNLCV